MGNGIELVRVAASTTQGKPHEGGACGAQHVIDFIGPLLSRQSDVWALNDIHRTTHQEPGGHVPAQRVSSNLLADELVVGLVGVECLDHVVPEPPCAQPLSVGLKTIALGEPDNIEPMASPAFSIAGILEHSIQQSLPGSGLHVRHKRGQLVWSRRNPQHHQVQPPNERRTIGLDRRRQPTLGETGLNEGIHRIGRTGRDFGGRNSRSDHRQECPVWVCWRSFGRAQCQRPQRSNAEPSQEFSSRFTHRGSGCLRWIHWFPILWSPRPPPELSRCAPWPCA